MARAAARHRLAPTIPRRAPLDAALDGRLHPSGSGRHVVMRERSLRTSFEWAGRASLGARTRRDAEADGS